jgi:hypothetical protein
MKQRKFTDDLSVSFELIDRLSTKKRILEHYLEKLKLERLEINISADRGELPPIFINDNLTANPLQLRIMQLIEQEIATFKQQLAELQLDF